METSFREFTRKPPKLTHEPITRIISKQLDIKLVLFTQEELDSVLRKIKIKKQQVLMYGRSGNVTTYCSDTVMPYIIKTQLTDGRRDAYSPLLRKATSD